MKQERKKRTRHEPEGLHLSNRGWHTHGFRHPKEASPEVVILLINPKIRNYHPIHD